MAARSTSRAREWARQQTRQSSRTCATCGNEKARLFVRECLEEMVAGNAPGLSYHAIQRELGRPGGAHGIEAGLKISPSTLRQHIWNHEPELYAKLRRDG